MLTLRTKVNFNQYDRTVERTTKALTAAMRSSVKRAGEAGARWSRRHHKHKRRTGAATSVQNLRSRIEYSHSTGARAAILNFAKHSRFIEYGTRPHIIRPKAGHGTIGPTRRGQSRRAIDDIGTHRVALRFKIGGRTIFRAKVRHPGNRPMPFMRPGLGEAGRVLVDDLEKQIARLGARIWT